MASSLRTLIPLVRSTTSTRFFSYSRPTWNIVSSTPPASLNEGEKHLYSKLFEKFQPSKLVVEDISGTVPPLDMMHGMHRVSIQNN